MKDFTLKKLTIILGIILLAVQFNYAQVSHGSMKGTEVPMYAQGTAGGNVSQPNSAATLDYKIVTKTTGTVTKSWAFLKFNGTSGINIGAEWQTQLRYWSSTNAKTENNLFISKDASAKTIFGSTTKAVPNPLNISFFQDLSTGGFSETLLIPYDITAKNTPFATDAAVPTLTACDAVPTETDVTLTMTGSDDSGDLFYYITDAAHGIEEFALTNTIKISGLSSSTSYNFTITPIDFNGKEGIPLTKTFTTGGLVQITSGIAKDIKFVLKSTATQLEYYYEFTDPAKTFRDAFIKITPAGGTEFEIKPTISPDGKYAYGVTTDSRIANKILSLNCGYFIFVPGDPNWPDYVVDNKVITSGSLTGTPIKHQMGGGISPAEAETVIPTLNNVTLSDAASNYVKLIIDGSDNSGTVYYEITGAKSTVDAFRTGDYYLTAIDPGKVYNLTLTPKDLSGNSGTPKTVTVKTMSPRGNIFTGNTGTSYNSTNPTTNPELVVNIAQSGNTLTLGCTTVSDLITNAGWKDRVFNTPTVKIDGVSYPLTLDANGNTASFTFTDAIGSKSIAPGTSFEIQWSVFWGATGGGNYFTGIYTYVVGDNGQSDVTGPSTPVLNLSGSTLTWNPSTDDLSGVKWYEITEEGQTPVKVYDLGDATFSYTLVDPTAVVKVVAVDFVNNTSSVASVNDTGTSVSKANNDAISIYPNPASNFIQVSGNVDKIILYTVTGQRLLESSNSNILNVAHLQEGMYLISITDENGAKNSAKIQIKR